MTPRAPRSIVFLLTALLPCVAAAVAPLRGAQDGAVPPLVLAARFQPHMVVQRGAPLRVDGNAAPDTSVTITFDGELSVTPADAAGRWSATFAPREGSVLPRQLVVEAGQQRLVIEDLLVGDVWLFAGAAELSAPLERPAAGQSRAPLPGHVRFQISTTAAPLGDVVWTPEQRRAVAERYQHGRWCRGDRVDEAHVSATAWHFARALGSEQRVPLGIVQLATAPVPLESWVPRAALLSEPRLAQRLVGWWRSESVDAGLRARARRHFAGHFDLTPEAPDEGVHPCQPGFLWDAVLGPLQGSPCAGVVFGCTTDVLDEPLLHEHLLRTLIGAWRERFTGRLPFVLVESSGRDLFLDPEGLSAALRRDAERRVASRDGGLPDVGGVVTSDLARFDRVPARRLQVIGERLAAWAVELGHGTDGVVASGPLPATFVKDTQEPLARLSFRHGEGLRTTDGGPPSGLSALAADGRAIAVRARIEVDGLVLELPDGVPPTELRYGFGAVWQGNLVNRAGLPAPTFRIELARTKVIEAGLDRGGR